MIPARAALLAHSFFMLSQRGNGLTLAMRFDMLELCL